MLDTKPVETKMKIGEKYYFCYSPNIKKEENAIYEIRGFVDNRVVVRDNEENYKVYHTSLYNNYLNDGTLTLVDEQPS